MGRVSGPLRAEHSRAVWIKACLGRILALWQECGSVGVCQASEKATTEWENGKVLFTAFTTPTHWIYTHAHNQRCAHKHACKDKSCGSENYMCIIGALWGFSFCRVIRERMWLDCLWWIIPSLGRLYLLQSETDSPCYRMWVFLAGSDCRN